MNDYCMIETASNNKLEIETIANELLENRLVASIYIVESDSSWNWKGKRESSKEYLLQMKTKPQKMSEIYIIIKKLHSYECFEFAAYEIKSINQEYLKWIDEEIN